VTGRRRSAPAGLGIAGRRLWRDVIGQYDLRADELRVLEAACGSADVIVSLQAALADAPPIVDGSRGQMRPNPLLGELRQERLAFAALLRQLALPNDPDSARELDAAAARTVRARRAAIARRT
jgi:hypothetical protein